MPVHTSTEATAWYVHSQSYGGMKYADCCVGQHVLHESTDWMYAFTLYLSLLSLYDYALSWLGTQEQSNSDTYSLMLKEEDTAMTPVPLITAADLLRKTLSVLRHWAKLFNLKSHHHSMAIDSFSDVQEFAAYELPEDRSFHLFLHRFLAAIVRQCIVYEHNTASLESFLHAPGFELLENAECVAMQHSLCALLWNVQIRSGLWILNGNVMNDQVLHYADSPYSTNGRDLDILMVQTMLVIASRQNNIVPFVWVVLWKMGLLKHVLELVPDKTPEVSEQCPSDKAAATIEELLCFFIQLVNTLPTAPVNTAEPEQRVRKLIEKVRREVVHSLAGGPTTYNVLSDAVSSIADYEECCRDCETHIALMFRDQKTILDGVLDEVATYRAGNALEAGKYSLKDSAWTLYDPTYHNITRNAHQGIVENRPKVVGTQPMVEVPLPAHPSFEIIRPLLLNDRALHQTMYAVTISYARQCVQQPLLVPSGAGGYSYKQFESFWPIHCSISTFSRCLQLLTLAAHSLKSGASDRWNDFCLSLSRETTSAIDEDVRFPSLLEILIEIEYSLSHSEKEMSNIKYWLKWFLNEMRGSEVCHELLEKAAALVEAAEKNSKAKLLETRQKQARERAMNALKQSAATFQKQMQMEGMSDDDEDSADDGMSLTKRKRNDTSEGSDETICIVCQNSSESEAIAYMAFSQYSFIGRRRCEYGESSADSCCGGTSSLHVSKDNERPPWMAQSEEDGKNEPYQHLQFCGHAIHINCFDGYFASLVEKSIHQTSNLLYDTQIGQFLCPLCKKIGNRLVPDLATVVGAEGIEQPALEVAPAAEPTASAHWLDFARNPIVMSKAQLNAGGDHADSGRSSSGDRVPSLIPNEEIMEVESEGSPSTEQTTTASPGR